MHAIQIITFCGIVVGGFACQWLGWRIKVPAILFLLITGVMVGPVLGWLDPDALLGDLLTPLVSIAVAIVLFEGSLTLKISEIRGHGSVVRNLVTVGVLVTWSCSAIAAYLFLGFDAYMAALFGAIVSVSGPTVVMPLLRTVRPSKAISAVLRWESILIDPIGAVLALLVFDVIVATQMGQGLLHVATTIGTIAVAGSVLGVAGGLIFGVSLRRRVIPDLLREFSALAAVLTVFALAETVQGESGLLAVTLMGITLANMRDVDLDDVLSFKESITLLLISGLFILLAAKLNLANLASLGVGAVVVLGILQLVVGPFRAFVSALGGNLNWREILFVGWVFPRGIVAAAISALFALRLTDIGYPNAGDLVPLVFGIIIGTVILQSATARMVARGLGVAAPEPNGVLIVGANPVARMFAKALQEAGKEVLVVDSHWASIREARMSGMPVFFGSPVSSYAEHNLDLTGFGTLLAVSRQPGLNELACGHFAEEFGRDNVYNIGNELERSHEKHRVAGASGGRILFGGEHTIDELHERIATGAKPKTTELSAEFGLAEYQERYPANLPIFATDANDGLRFPVHDQEFDPDDGWHVTSLVNPEPGG